MSKEPINYGQLDPQQRLDVARGVGDTKDCTRLPVVAIGSVMFVDRHDFDGVDAIETFRSLTLLDEGETELCRLTDAQALIAELRAENERLSKIVEDAKTALPVYEDTIAALRAQLQAAPAERGVVLPERRFECPMENRGDQFSWGWNACLDKFSSLNPAPATADSDVREVSE